MQTTVRTPDLELRPGERGRYVVRSEKWGYAGDQSADPLITYGVWDRETGDAIDSYTSRQGATTLAFWLNGGWPLDTARREADLKHAWAFCN